MEIRRTRAQDVERLMEIYAHARAFMASTGNPRQWGPNRWPPEALIQADIAAGKSFVCREDDRIIGTFFYDFGPEVEPTYARIEDGSWLDPAPYGVVHRIAADGTVRGTGAFCLNWAYEQCHHLRIDTHADNVVMQNLLKKLGFTPCGTIFVHEDNDPRIAFEKTETKC